MHYRHLLDDLSLEIYVVRFVVSQWRLSLFMDLFTQLSYIHLLKSPYTNCINTIALVTISSIVHETVRHYLFVFHRNAHKTVAKWKKVLTTKVHRQYSLNKIDQVIVFFH